MTVGTVLDPTALRDDDVPGPGPDAGSLAGKIVGLRVDILWRSWDWVADEWAASFRAQGADVRFWRSGGRVGDEGRQMTAELEAFLSVIDVAIVGLGNCGSCTSWTIRDAIAAARRDIPTTAVVTAHFEDLGRTLAARGGRSGLRFEVLPYPLDIQPEGDVRDIARRQYRSLLRTIGVPA